MSTARLRRRELQARLALDDLDSIGVGGQTVNAATATVDTGYKVPSGLAAKLDGNFLVVDRANHIANSGNLTGTVRALPASPMVVAGFQAAGQHGDAALSTATITAGITGGGDLQLTLTPPGGYVGTLDWNVTITPSEGN